MKTLIMALMAVVSSLSFAQSSLNGIWSTKTGLINLYSEQGIYKYNNCSTDLMIISSETEIAIQKLASQCSHPQYWDFSPKLPAVSFKIEKGNVYTDTGLKIGTINEKAFDLKFNLDGAQYFLEGFVKANGELDLEWNLRSFDEVNFDVIGNLQKQ